MRALVLALALGTALPTAARPESLAELEADVVRGPTVALAEADVAVGQALLAQRHAEGGFKLYGGPTVATSEGDPGVDIRNFQGASVDVGIRYPLFGTRSLERLGVLNAETQVVVSKARVRAAERQALLELRRQYASYWGSHQTLDLARRFLAIEDDVRPALEQRRDAGFLLEADRREFMTGFSEARRRFAAAEGSAHASLDAIRRLVARPVAEFVAPPPVLPPPCLDASGVETAVEATHPDLAALRAVVREKGDARQLAAAWPVDSGVNLSQHQSRTFVDNQTGRATMLSVDVRIPLNFLEAYRARRDGAAAVFGKARLELALREQQLRAAAAQAVETYRTRQENVRFAVDRLASAEEAVREAALRRDHLPGDVIEKEEQAVFHRYRGSVDMVRAQVLLSQAHADLLALAPDGCQTMAGATAPRDGGSAPSTPSPVSVYVWNAEPLLTGEPSAVMERFAAHRIGRLLLSLDGRQIERVQTPEGGRSLSSLLAAARKKGMSVELLLGDPSWILPEQRPALLATVRALAAVPFAGLHLDLEPNQLDEKSLGQEFLLRELLATLASVQGVSPWPVGLSVHPRYLAAPVGDATFGARLSALALHEVTLMIYVANPRRVFEIASPILEAHPDLRFSVAQSIEPSLAPEESYAVRSGAELARRMQEVSELFAGARNFQGIVVQSWEHYGRLDHEAAFLQQRSQEARRGVGREDPLRPVQSPDVPLEMAPRSRRPAESSRVPGGHRGVREGRHAGTRHGGRPAAGDPRHESRLPQADLGGRGRPRGGRPAGGDAERSAARRETASAGGGAGRARPGGGGGHRPRHGIGRTGARPAGGARGTHPPPAHRAHALRAGGGHRG
jgi:outer membrane protein TolC